ncbi:HEXXH motif domain-containing protein [Lentzea tibetensis]|uniref:HEXXH motif domain-containing protein n=2 Tax=Lentzea tibetensis TaxID=2591470 RepID=A0A563EY73_9PSEU|nr:HEXXH motif domain-containing protein [Lentzea tibetensis]
MMCRTLATLVGSGTHDGNPISMVKPPAVESIHASIAPADTLLAERRALYSLAVELLCPDMGDSEVADEVLDSPLVRFHIGEALAGRADITLGELTACLEAPGTTRSAHGLPVIADARAHEPLAPLLRTIETQPGLRLLTDGPRFEQAYSIVEQGVLLALKVSPGLIEDLLAHVNLFAVLDPDTSHGLASASSRWFPGIVLIDAPATPIEVAEGLVHEAAHQKFFDFAITRQFLGAKSDTAEQFVTSWSKKSWPMEQTVAAWHAYSLMYRFAMDAGVAEGHCEVSAASLLPKAGERAAEIGNWLVAHAEYLENDARTLLAGLLETVEPLGFSSTRSTQAITGRLRLAPDVRVAARKQRGQRIVVATASIPPELYWVDPDAADSLQLIKDEADGLEVDDLVDRLAAQWGVVPEFARPRVSTGLQALLDAALIH